MAKIIDPAVQEALDKQAEKLAALHEKAIAKLTKDHEKALAALKRDLVATVKSVEPPAIEDKAVLAHLKAHHKSVLAALTA